MMYRQRFKQALYVALHVIMIHAVANLLVMSLLLTERGGWVQDLLFEMSLYKSGIFFTALWIAGLTIPPWVWAPTMIFQGYLPAVVIVVAGGELIRKIRGRPTWLGRVRKYRFPR